jgi:hypothetical protein
MAIIIYSLTKYQSVTKGLTIIIMHKVNRSEQARWFGPKFNSQNNEEMGILWVHIWSLFSPPSYCTTLRSLPLFWSIGLISQFLNHFTDGRTPWAGDQLVARPLPIHRTTQTQKNTRTHQTSMPWVGFKPTIQACERVKTVRALDRSGTVPGIFGFSMS